MRQFKPTSEWIPNDQFTMGAQHLTTCINFVKKYCIFLRASQQQAQPAGQRVNAAQAMATGNQPNQPPLNANNLHQLQQQEEALQRARRASSQSATGAPAPFGTPSPQGVPHAYGPGSMPPEKLKLPPPKKRKQSHAGPFPGQSPAPGTPTTKAAAATAKASAADGKQQAAALPFKCSVLECQQHYQGFATQASLDKHIEENHKADDVIEDPLEFALEGMRNCLVKDEQAEVPGLKKGDLKLEGATPATASATTPMGRMPSQLKAGGSPASNQQLTPRPSSDKTPAAMKATVSKESKKGAGKPGEPSDADATLKDAWADSGVSLEAIHDTFTDFGNDGLNGLGLDPLEEFLNADMFVNAEAKDTPESIETGGATQTPKDGELSKDEEMNVNIESNLDDSSWLPDDWIFLPGRFNDQFLVSGPTEIDWDSIDRKEMGVPDQPALAIHAM